MEIYVKLHVSFSPLTGARGTIWLRTKAISYPERCYEKLTAESFCKQQFIRDPSKKERVSLQHVLTFKQ